VPYREEQEGYAAGVGPGGILAFDIPDSLVPVAEGLVANLMMQPQSEPPVSLRLVTVEVTPPTRLPLNYHCTPVTMLDGANAAEVPVDVPLLGVPYVLYPTETNIPLGKLLAGVQQAMAPPTPSPYPVSRERGEGAECLQPKRRLGGYTRRWLTEALLCTTALSRNPNEVLAAYMYLLELASRRVGEDGAYDCSGATWMMLRGALLQLWDPKCPPGVYAPDNLEDVTVNAELTLGLRGRSVEQLVPSSEFVSPGCFRCKTDHDARAAALVAPDAIMMFQQGLAASAQGDMDGERGAPEDFATLAA
jgi:hypothetical protein